MFSHLHRQQSNRLQVELIPPDSKMSADYNQGMTYKLIYMSCDDYVPAIILSHIVSDHAEIKYVYVLMGVGCDFNSMASVMSMAWQKYRVCVGISH
jgi:hypothetical protein